MATMTVVGLEYNTDNVEVDVTLNMGGGTLGYEKVSDVYTSGDGKVLRFVNRRGDEIVTTVPFILKIQTKKTLLS